MSTEEERAALHRANQVKKRDEERRLAVLMRGDPEAAREIREGLQPLIDATRDARTSEPDPVERHDRTRWTPA